MATSLNNLAALYYAQGRYDKAEPMYERSLAIFKKTLDDKHPITTQSHRILPKSSRKIEDEDGVRGCC